MKIADAHTHIFPHKISEKASKAIGDFYGIEMAFPADVELLCENERKIGTECCLVCSAATTAAQVVSINDFIAAECKKANDGSDIEFVGLCAMHVDFDGIPDELDRAKELGLVGVKFHNDFQRFDIDDPRAMDMYREIAKRDMVVLFHAGDDRYDYTAPQKIANVANKFPEMTIIASHFGGYRCWDKLDCLPRDTNVYFDTSSSLDFISTDKAMELIEHFGADRFMFGTDFPMWDAETELARFMKLPLSESEREDVLYNNFRKLFPKR
ncbi:MAG: radical SAM protein [Ruminococcaceae bacterium]|nr:radical SAM protein [Oscillospiraceae bacterium]